MSNLFTELKRRNVFRVTAAYLVISWLLLQVGDVLFDALRLDDSLTSFLVAILALGFIPVVVFSWVYEITPEGIKRDTDVPADHSIGHHTAKKLDIITIVSVIALIAIFWFKPNRLDQQSAVTQIESQQEAKSEETSGLQSIAVLPFEDMSSTGDQEYFGDGIAEELLNSLAKTKGLRVAARTSSFKFKGAGVDIPAIGNALNVKTVLEGSIRKAGDQIRVTAQLINVDDGYHIWSEAYDRKLDNIFQVQDEITLAIVDALKLHLDIDTSESNLINPAAYELYLRGKQSARTIDKASQLQAVDYYQQSLSIEPEFAKAHAGVAAAWIWLEDYGGFSAEIAYPKIEQASRTALNIDSKSPEAIMSLGLFYARVKDDTETAQLLFEYALELNPSMVEGYNHYADILDSLGKEQQAINQRLKAIDLDPLSTYFRARLAVAYFNSNKKDLGIAQLNKVFEMNPEDTYALEELANMQFYESNYIDSYQNYVKVHNSRAGDPFAAHFLTRLAFLVGLPEKSNYWLEKTRARGEDNRWLLNAQAYQALSKGDVETFAKIIPKINLRAPAIAASMQAYSYYLKGDYSNAQKHLDIVTKDSRFTQATIDNDLILAIFTQALLEAHNQQPEQPSYQKIKAKAEQLQAGEAFISNLGRLDLSAYVMMACLDAVKPEQAVNHSYIEQMLALAIDSNYRDATRLVNMPCFDAVKDKAYFKQAVTKIEQLIAPHRKFIAQLEPVNFE
jgi:TolB-like protein/Tfp pilus assembly protein PilF